MVKVEPSRLNHAKQAWADENASAASTDPNFAGSHTGSAIGCLPGTNCCVIVPQDQWFSVERFGKYQGILSPGLNFAGLDCFGICLGFRSISSRISQSISVVTTKTKDNVFVTLRVAVQLSVSLEGAAAAMYKLSDRDLQMDSYISDVVRSRIPTLCLDQAFENREAISGDIQARLEKEMAFYGITIHQVLITELEPDKEVIKSMNEINKQRRLRDAVEMAAEANKIRTVKAAEAACDAKYLQGCGVARQQRAIIRGLEESITQANDETLSLGIVRELLVATQYHQMVRKIASECQDQTVFISHGAGSLSDAASRVKSRIQASSAPGQVRM